MPSVFISYARLDHEAAERLYDDLKKIGVKTWIDSKSILPGQTWEFEIEKAMRESDFIIMLFSQKGVEKTGYFQKEQRMAIRLLDEVPPDRTRLIPCRLDNAGILHSRLKELNYVDFFPSYSDALGKIKAAIGVDVSDEMTSEQIRELMRQTDQNLLKYQLSRYRSQLDQSIASSRQEWISELLLETTKTERRLYETLTRVQQAIPMYQYSVKPLGCLRFVLKFKHNLVFGNIEWPLKKLLENERVNVIDARSTQTLDDHSVFMIPDDDCEAAIIRYSNGRRVRIGNEGVFDLDTHEKLSDEEFQELQNQQKTRGSGFYVK